MAVFNGVKWIYERKRFLDTVLVRHINGNYECCPLWRAIHPNCLRLGKTEIEIDPAVECANRYAGPTKSRLQVVGKRSGRGFECS